MSSKIFLQFGKCSTRAGTVATFEWYDLNGMIPIFQLWTLISIVPFYWAGFWSIYGDWRGVWPGAMAVSSIYANLVCDRGLSMVSIWFQWCGHLPFKRRVFFGVAYLIYANRHAYGKGFAILILITSWCDGWTIIERGLALTYRFTEVERGAQLAHTVTYLSRRVLGLFSSGFWDEPEILFLTPAT